MAGLAGQESRQNENSTHSVMLPALKDSLPGEVPIGRLFVLSLCKFAAVRVRCAPFIFCFFFPRKGEERKNKKIYSEGENSGITYPGGNPKKIIK